MSDPSQPVIKVVKTGHKFAPKRFWDVIAPLYFVIFQAQVGSVLALGDKMFILAVFPETISGAPMSQPDPGSLGDCKPELELTIENIDSQIGSLSETYIVRASPFASQVEDSYRVRFKDQANLYTSTGIYNKPWVFALDITAGMKSASVIVGSVMIPSGCNSNTSTFINSAYDYPPTATVPNGVLIDTVLPAVVSYSSTSPAGNYTSGVSHANALRIFLVDDRLISKYVSKVQRVSSERLEMLSASLD